jgi:hypothetical protein
VIDAIYQLIKKEAPRGHQVAFTSWCQEFKVFQEKFLMKKFILLINSSKVSASVVVLSENRSHLGPLFTLD